MGGRGWNGERLAALDLMSCACLCIAASAPSLADGMLARRIAPRLRQETDGVDI